jgi:hypothetical protein
LFSFVFDLEKVVFTEDASTIYNWCHIVPESVFFVVFVLLLQPVNDIPLSIIVAHVYRQIFPIGVVLFAKLSPYRRKYLLSIFEFFVLEQCQFVGEEPLDFAVHFFYN